LKPNYQNILINNLYNFELNILLYIGMLELNVRNNMRLLHLVTFWIGQLFLYVYILYSINKLLAFVNNNKIENETTGFIYSST